MQGKRSLSINWTPGNTLSKWKVFQLCSVKVKEKMQEIVVRKRALQEIVTFKEQQI